jgi:pimeloyl-ACP methyl ester carboxylesterase
MGVAQVGFSSDKILPVAGEQFLVDGYSAFLIMPDKKVSGLATPWVFYAPTLKPYPGTEEKWMIKKFLAAGVAIAGIDVGESYGSPEGTWAYTAFHKELVQKRGMAPKAALLARSRGGLMLYNWASDNPEKVACIAGIYPVCDLRSYPGLERAAEAYGLASLQMERQLPMHNPIDRLESIADAMIPIFHIHGDADTVVPLEQNSAELARRYRKLGGTITLEVVKGKGHDMWTGWFKSETLVDFVIANVNQ